MESDSPTLLDVVIECRYCKEESTLAECLLFQSKDFACPACSRQFTELRLVQR